MKSFSHLFFIIQQQRKNTSWIQLEETKKTWRNYNKIRREILRRSQIRENWDLNVTGRARQGRAKLLRRAFLVPDLFVHSRGTKVSGFSNLFSSKKNALESSTLEMKMGEKERKSLTETPRSIVFDDNDCVRLRRRCWKKQSTIEWVWLKRLQTFKLIPKNSQIIF